MVKAKILSLLTSFCFLASCGQNNKGFPYPLPGEYEGKIITGVPGSPTHTGLAYNEFTGKAQITVQVQPIVGSLNIQPAPCGNLFFKSAVTYVLGGETGSYSFDATWGTLTFTSGPLKNSPSAYLIKNGMIYMVVVVEYKNGVKQQTYFERAAPEYAGRTFDPKQINNEKRIGQYKGKLIRSTSKGTAEIFALDKKESLVLTEAEEMHISKTGDMVMAVIENNEPVLKLVTANGNKISLGKICDKFFYGYSGAMMAESSPAYPAISPDGQKIAFFQYRNTSVWGGIAADWKGVVVFDRQGNKLAELKDRTQPEWLDDGRLITVTQESYSFQGKSIVIYDKHFRDEKRIDNGLPFNSGVSVSPDNKMIAYIGNNEFYIATIDGANTKKLAMPLPGETLFCTAWSPDGTAVAVSENSDLYIVPIDGSHPSIKVLDNNKLPLVMNVAKFVWHE